MHFRMLRWLAAHQPIAIAVVVASPFLTTVAGAQPAAETTGPALTQSRAIDPATMQPVAPKTAPSTAEPGTRLQPAPPPREPEPGKVWPTASGGLGGATSYTQRMPLDVEGLIELRQPFTNRPEFRCAWVTRFDWAGRGGNNADANALKKRITEIMESAKDINLNAIMFQVRGDATTLYPSKLEPWSQLLGGKDPGFDPVKFAVDEAHRCGLEFHAYMNPVPCSEEKTSGPVSKDHIFYKHCLPDSVPNWLVFKDGKPAPFNEYKWMNPNLPDVQLYIRTAVLDFVRRYNIDGVHFDRIRFPGPDVSDDQWSKARFANGTNPDNKTYPEWQAGNISRMLADIYGAIMEIKPKTKISASVWGIYDNTVLPQGNDKAVGYTWTSSGLQDFMQDSVGWLNQGSMDAIVPMMYWGMGDIKPDYDELLYAFRTSTRTGRHVYGGLRVFSNEEMIRQVVATNLIGGEGTVPFTLARITRPEMKDFYKKHIYPEKVPVPDMPWKSKPLFGNLLVTVTGADGKPVTDAQVKIAGRKGVALSAADGYCATLNVVPGEIEVTAEKAGSGSATQKTKITRGKTTRIAMKLAAQ